MGDTFQPICDLLILKNSRRVRTTIFVIVSAVCQSPFRPSIRLSNPFSKSFNLPSINFRNQDTHSYKASGTLTILYVLIFRPAFLSTIRHVRGVGDTEWNGGKGSAN